MLTVSLLLFPMVLTGVWGCCFAPFEGFYCRDDITVVRGKAFSASFFPQERDRDVFLRGKENLYNVEVVDVFKAPVDTNIKVGDTIKAITSKELSCRGYLPLNTDVLITGGWDGDGRLEFWTCSINNIYNDLAYDQKSGMKIPYPCECQSVPNNIMKRNRCYLKIGSFKNETVCAQKYGPCNNCEWPVEHQTDCNLPASTENEQ